jgi:hypothetical protein
LIIIFLLEQAKTQAIMFILFIQHCLEKGE